MKYISRARQTMDLVDHVLQHPLAAVVHRESLSEENRELIKFWEQDPYVMFTDETKVLQILKALPAFIADVESCTDDELDLIEADELNGKIARELTALLNRWENYTPLVKATEAFYSTVQSVALDGEACRAGRLIEEIISVKTLQISTSAKPSESLVADYITHGERFIDTVEYYETVEPFKLAMIAGLREKLLKLEVVSLMANVI